MTVFFFCPGEEKRQTNGENGEKKAAFGSWWAQVSNLI